MIEAREKFRRARVLMGWSQDRCDEVSLGERKGRAQSYERGRAVPTREYLTPLAKVWSIPLEWFFDGQDDLPPVSGQPLPAGAPVPIMGRLPAKDCRSAKQGERAAKVGFDLPPGAQYRQYSHDLGECCLRRGDWLLVVPADFPFPDTLAMIDTGESCDVYVIKGLGTSARPVPLAEGQAEPRDSWRLVGIVVELQRNRDGLTLQMDRELGLTTEDLAKMPG